MLFAQVDRNASKYRIFDVETPFFSVSIIVTIDAVIFDHDL